MKQYDKNIKRGVGERLRKARQTMHFSLSDVERITGLARNRISDYENEKRATSILTLENLCKCYNVSIEYIWNGDGPIDAHRRYTSKEEYIIKSLEDLYYYQIIDFKNGFMTFNALEDGLLISFIREYASALNSDNNKIIVEIEKQYIKQIEQSLKKDKENILYKLEEM